MDDKITTLHISSNTINGTLEKQRLHISFDCTEEEALTIQAELVKKVNKLRANLKTRKIKKRF